MDTSSAGLFARIREKCQRDGWYGGELDGPTCRYVRPDHPQRRGFAYPKAGEEQVQATEAALGFPLPPLMRTRYAEVANGGFGPGAGISGTLGGYGSRTDEPTSTIVNDYHFCSQIGYASMGRSSPVRLVDLADYAQHWLPTPSGKGLLLLPYAVWPAQLLPLEDLGCCQHACLDCKTGRVFCTAPSASDEEYELGPVALRSKSTWSAGFRVNCYREGRALQRCAGVTDADLASECDAVVAVTNCARAGRCDDTAAVTWGKEYIRGQSTHSRAALLAVGRCENRIRRHWLWGPFSPRILGLALPGRRWMILCKKHRPLAGKGSTDVTSSLGNRDWTDASRLGPGHIRPLKRNTENENVREALAGGLRWFSLLQPVLPPVLWWHSRHAGSRDRVCRESHAPASTR